jgi:NAD(P)-dependent dehydrogenase (short-subunit alcohol dehydrogenase family)
LNGIDGKNLIAYGLSKSLLFKLAEYLNEEAKGKNVTATVVVPSTLDTPLNRKNMPEANPGNWVKPDALADVLEFIVSDKSSPLRETVLKVYDNS